MSRQIFIDTETTGLSAAQGHRIIELAAVETINGQATGRVLHTFLNPQRSIDPYAQAVHGCSAEMLADKPLFSEIASDFIDFVRGAECLMDRVPGRGVRVAQEVMDSGIVGMPIRRSRRTG